MELVQYQRVTMHLSEVHVYHKKDFSFMFRFIFQSTDQFLVNKITKGCNNIVFKKIDLLK